LVHREATEVAIYAASTVASVVVVTPVHNGVAHTLRFLESAQQLTYPDVKVVIVDDGSTDGTAAAIASQFPMVTVIRGDGSLWWSKATNIGVEWARANGADYVLTVNSDTELDPAIITTLVALAEDNPRALVGSMVVTAEDPDRVWFFGTVLDLASSDLRNVNGRIADFDAPREVETLTGMGMLIPVAAFDEVGPFDDKRLPQYLADSDFALRARKIGYRLLVTPSAVVVCDIESSWIAAARAAPRLSHPVSLLFARRSPENVLYRWRFYRRHWPERYRRAVLHHVASVVKNDLLLDFVPRYAARWRRGGRQPAE